MPSAPSARRRDIAAQFQLENLSIVGLAYAVGAAGTVLLNHYLMSQWELPALPFPYVLEATGLVMLIGQLAFYAPSRQAANISPAAAIRGR